MNKVTRIAVGTAAVLYLLDTVGNSMLALATAHLEGGGKAILHAASGATNTTEIVFPPDGVRDVAPFPIFEIKETSESV